MPLEPGHRLGPYVIKSLLGAGGMGEVYRGRDTRLGRDVALKVVSGGLAGDESHRRRFETEARAASALNHPSIVTIYDIGDTGGVPWIAMEWVEGRTIRQALADGPLPIAAAIEIGRQTADALAAAHARGIVHRDLKPENAMLLPDSRVKILDFGLARQTFVDGLENSAAGADTITSTPRTFEGAILGTVGYMSPEQASGRAADFQSDQFAFGLLLYEMLAGRRAFFRPTAVETLSAVIRDEPVPLSSLRGGIPAAVVAVVDRCLAKAPADRFASTTDLVEALTRAAAGLPAASAGTASIAPAAPAAATPGPGVARVRAAHWPLYAGAAIVAALAGLGWYGLSTSRESINSLAVLPFENSSREPDADYLGEGITENLIERISRLPSVRVMARGTVMKFKGAADPLQVGKALGVGAVVTGTVSRRGSQIVIAAELIETATGARLWGETYDRPAADLLRVQDSIASEISDGLRLRLSGEDRRSLTVHQTENNAAYDLFIRGRFLMSSDTEEDDLEARRLFREAAKLDPTFVDALSGIVNVSVRRAGNGYAPPAEAWAEALEPLAEALRLDPANIGARATLANRRFQYEWDFPAAEKLFREISGDPRLYTSVSYHPVSMFYLWRGWADEAVGIMERALAVDSANLESKIMLGNFLAQAGRLDQAIVHYQGIVRAEPTDPRSYFGLADVLRRRGRTEDAIAALRKAYELNEEDEGMKALSTARTEADLEKAEVAVARRQLETLRTLAKERYVSPLDLASLESRTGARERVFPLLDQALAERSAGLVFLKLDRAWDRVRDDARFVAVVRKVGIP